MADNYKEKLEQQDHIDYVVDNDRKSQIVSLVDSHFSGEIARPDALAGDRFNFESVQKSLHTRTSIKIQDGCDNFCSFCIIPSVRGKAISRPLGDILENVRKVLDHGFKEIVVTGVNIGRYEYEGRNFENVLEQILELPGDFRVRISSLEPDGFSEDFHRLFQHPKLMPHLHLCLQSGSEKVLLKMRRMYSAKYFREIIERFRSFYPEFNFSTDVIVGFPGESEEDFRETLALVKDLQFSHIHTFRYSRRTGTRADRMSEQVSGKVMAERSERIRHLSEQMRLEYMKQMLGKKQRVLIEKRSKEGIANGYGEYYLPIEFKSDQRTTNSFEDVILEKIKEGVDPLISARTIK
jgi:threonylcarbamoyladenosine tRNA methylthiotransferase MtaB